MKISIIIPVYNVSQYIERCLLSVLEQTYTDLELIIIDDASPDDSMDKVAKILNHCKIDYEIKIVKHTSNKGLSAARNTGIQNATGEYLYFLDSDDSIPKNSIEVLTGYLAHSPTTDVVAGKINIIYQKKNIHIPSIHLSLKDATVLQKEEVINSFLKNEWYETAWNKLIKRNFFIEKNNWFMEGIVHEDTLWSFNMAYHINSMIICDKITYNYFINNHSITTNKKEKNFNSMIVILEKMLSQIPQKDYIEKKDLLCIYFTRLKIFFLKSLYVSDCDNFYKKEMKKKLKYLFSHPLFDNWNKPLSFSIKENILNTLINFSL